jgi:hypothetical protein
MQANFVELKDAFFAPVSTEPELPYHPSSRPSLVLDALIYRPSVFRRNEMRWISVFNWRAGHKANGLAALRRAKQTLDRQVISEASVSIAALACELFGDHPADAVTNVPCGHSRRPDCFGKQLAQAVAANLQLRFVQVFADRPAAGGSHPKQNTQLTPLRQIGSPPRSVLLVDDLATSGAHMEESTIALRKLGVSGPAIAWISGLIKGGPAYLPPRPDHDLSEAEEARDRDVLMY